MIEALMTVVAIGLILASIVYVLCFWLPPELRDQYAIYYPCDQTIAFLGEDTFVTTSPAKAALFDTPEQALAAMKAANRGDDGHVLHVRDVAEFRSGEDTW